MLPFPKISQSSKEKPKSLFEPKNREEKKRVVEGGEMHEGEIITETLKAA